MPLNGGFTYTGFTGDRDAGVALLDHLCARYPHSSRREWLDRIAGGLVRLDGRPADPLEVLLPGQRLTWERPPWEEPDVPLAYALLHRDGALLAVAKPAGLPTLPGAGFLDHTLLALVRRRSPEAAPAHRLGRGTSGLVLFGRTAEASRALSRLFRERGVVKVYRALVQGHPDREAFCVEAPIGPVPHPTLGTVHAASDSGRPARSDVRLLERREGTSLVEVRIETGRPHQIRIHMAACGHPLWGDPLYGPGGLPRGEAPALPGETGYLLHAGRVSLPHPTTGAHLALECRPPRALRLEGEP